MGSIDLNTSGLARCQTGRKIIPAFYSLCFMIVTGASGNPNMAGDRLSPAYISLRVTLPFTVSRCMVPEPSPMVFTISSPTFLVSTSKPII